MMNCARSGSQPMVGSQLSVSRITRPPYVLLRRAGRHGHLTMRSRRRSSLCRSATTRYDSNAVRVDVGGRCVGYLARGDAEAYQPRLLDMARRGIVAVCPGRIMGGGSRYYGIHLHLAAPEWFQLANDIGDVVMLEASRNVTVTGEGEHQEPLRRYAPADGTPFVRVFATMRFCTIVSGKYAGERAVEVCVDGHRVGQLTRRMSERYERPVEIASQRAQAVACEGLVVRSEKGLELELRLP